MVSDGWGEVPSWHRVELVMGVYPVTTSTAPYLGTRYGSARRWAEGVSETGRPLRAAHLVRLRQDAWCGQECAPKYEAECGVILDVANTERPTGLTKCRTCAAELRRDS